MTAPQMSSPKLFVYPKFKRKRSLTGFRVTLFPPKPRPKSSSYGILKLFCLAVLAVLVVGALRFAVLQIRLLYSHWRHIPVEVLDKCSEVEWLFHQPLSVELEQGFGGFASTSFHLPSNESFFFLSQGNLSYGTIEFLPSVIDALEDVQVDVTVRYRTRAIFSRATVCSLAPEQQSEEEKAGDGNGIMFYTPEATIVPPKEDQLRFHIKVMLPTALDSQTHIRSVTTDLPTFSHSVGPIGRSHVFDKIRLSTLESIHVHSLEAESIHLSTFNNSVTGTMTSWSSGRIETANAPIKVNFTLTTHPELYSKHTSLFMKTSNDALTSSITLDPKSSFSPDVFKVTTKTSNGELLIAFPEAESSSALDSSGRPHLIKTPPPVLRFDGQTSNGLALIDIPPSYQGSFSLRSERTHPRLIFKQDPPQREVVSSTSDSGNLVKGRIYPPSTTAGLRTGAHSGGELSYAFPPAWVNVRTTNDRAEILV